MKFLAFSLGGTMLFAGVVAMVNTSGDLQLYSGITAVTGMLIALTSIAAWIEEIT